jgi:hypothetical protein
MKLADLLAGSKANALNFFPPTVVANVEKRLADKEGKPVIRCLVRDKQLAAKSEEIIRQLWLEYLVRHYKYDVRRLAVEVPVTFGRDTSKRADIVIWDADRENVAHCMIETKAPTLKAGKDQLKSYTHATGAPLALGNWQPPEPLTYTRRASEALTARRLDSQYFAPRVAELIAHLSTGGRTLRDVAPPRHENFFPSRDGDFRYIEISDVHGDGTTSCTTLAMSDTPSRATQFVRAGDVLTSTVRPNRRLSAIVSPEQDGCVASSGFVVLQPTVVPAEVLLTYLRLPLFCELMDLHTSASLYPAISDRDLLALPFPKINKPTCDKIVSAVRSAQTARARAHELLDRAKRTVEIAIEKDERAALKSLDGVDAHGP